MAWLTWLHSSEDAALVVVLGLVLAVVGLGWWSGRSAGPGPRA